MNDGKKPIFSNRIKQTRSVSLKRMRCPVRNKKRRGRLRQRLLLYTEGGGIGSRAVADGEYPENRGKKGRQATILASCFVAPARPAPHARAPFSIIRAYPTFPEIDRTWSPDCRTQIIQQVPRGADRRPTGRRRGCEKNN